MTWTEHELQILEKHYARRGVKAVQEHLKRHGYNRSIHSIYSKACRRMMDDTPKNMVPLSTVHPRSDETQTPARYAYKKALQDGVLKERPHRLRRYLVPTWWADQYIKTLEERMEADTSNWWTTTYFAHRLGIDRRKLWRIRTHRAPHPLAHKIRAIPTRRGYHTPAVYYEPNAAQEIVTLTREHTS
jgi:hypothetical protein